MVDWFIQRFAVCPPSTSHEKVSHQKNPLRNFLIESWLFNRDPYIDLSTSPHNWVPPGFLLSLEISLTYSTSTGAQHANGHKHPAENHHQGAPFVAQMREELGPRDEEKTWMLWTLEMCWCLNDVRKRFSLMNICSFFQWYYCWWFRNPAITTLGCIKPYWDI